MNRIASLQGPRFAFVLTLGILLVCGLIWYTSAEGCSALAEFPSLSLAYRLFCILFFCVFIIAMRLIQRLPFSIARFISIIAGPYFHFFVNQLLSSVVIDLIRLFNFLIPFSSDNLREFRKTWFYATLLLIAAMYIAGYINFQHPRIVNLTIDSPFSKHNRVLRILLASDLHLGYLCDKAKFRKWVSLMNSQRPDIVLLAGDLSDNHMPPIVQQNLCEEFDQISSKFGIFAVSGNHEFYLHPPGCFEQYMRQRTKVRYLRDEVALVDNSVYIVGRDDRTNRNRASIADLVRGLDREKAVIVVDHYPTDMTSAEASGVTLALSGHTHRGQFFPVTAVVPFVFENYHGYRRRGDSQFYVSSGLGLWGPQCRFGSTSEIVNIQFRF